MRGKNPPLCGSLNIVLLFLDIKLKVIVLSRFSSSSGIRDMKVARSVRIHSMDELFDWSSHHWFHSGGVATLDSVFDFAEVGTAVLPSPFIRVLGWLQFEVLFQMFYLGQSFNWSLNSSWRSRTNRFSSMESPFATLSRDVDCFHLCDCSSDLLVSAMFDDLRIVQHWPYSSLFLLLLFHGWNQCEIFLG